MSEDLGQIRNIITGYELVPYDRLKLHPMNARESDMDALEISLDQNGFYDPCVVQFSTRYILKGNHRYIKMGEKGAPVVPTIWVDCDDATALRILLADNKITELGSYDNQKLAELLEMARNQDGGLLGTGYTDDDAEALMEMLANATLGEDDSDDEDETADISKEPGNDGNTIPKLTFGKYQIPLTQPEYNALEQRLKDHKADVGSYFGFVRSLLDV